jgi:hypothetical protein
LAANLPSVGCYLNRLPTFFSWLLAFLSWLLTFLASKRLLL